MVHGLVDIHFHGQGGFDVMSGDPEDLHGLSERLRPQGVAGFLATLVSSPLGETITAIETLKKVQGGERGAKILGVHLEGPFLHPERKGAHNPRHLRPPDPKEVREWIAAGEGIVKLVTIAPELPGAGAVIKLLLKKGVRVSMGHSSATFEQARAAKKLGVRSVTHLFNAMNPLHHRAPGLPGFALVDDELYTEIIADGVHVSDEMVRLVLRSRPAKKIILISDGLFLTGCATQGIVHLGGLKVRVFPDGSLRLLDGTLAGSNATLRHIVDRLIAMKAAPAKDILAMATTNPLEMLGLKLPR
jgi:N-acetylglucosamine-6-phosphate deacetylase